MKSILSVAITVLLLLTTVACGFTPSPVPFEVLTPEGETIINGTYVLSAEAIWQSHADTDNVPAVVVTLNDEGAARFRDATAANIGNTLTVMLDGKVLCEPEIPQTIDGGQFVLTVPSLETRDDAEHLAARIVASRQWAYA